MEDKNLCEACGTSHKQVCLNWRCVGLNRTKKTQRPIHHTVNGHRVCCEMEDKNLIKLLLLCSIIGIFLLFLLIETQDLKSIPLNQVEQYKDQVVKVQGQIEKITVKEKVAFIDIKDQTGNLVLVKFNPKNKEFSQLKQGNNITATGKVQFYQDKWEIILQELICTSC